MMLQKHWRCPSPRAPWSPAHHSHGDAFFLALSRSRTTTNILLRTRNPKPHPPSSRFICLVSSSLGLDDFAQIAHNKVLIAAGLSAAIGQLLKPFTSSLLYGKDSDIAAAFQAGGFPSTHSSAVVATATTLALERGLSDSIFGLTVVYASLVMYDAQGVRREVGNHARTLNKMLSNKQTKLVDSRDGDDSCDSQQGTPSSSYNAEGVRPPHLSKEFESKLSRASLLLDSERKIRPTGQMLKPSDFSVELDQKTEKEAIDSAALKESIGHTEVEVMAGALLGFFVSLGVCAIM